MAKDFDIKWYGKVVMDKATKANATAMKKAVLLVEGHAKQSVRRQGTGREITRYRANTPSGSVSKYKHKVSRPGHPPALDSGTLMSSLSHKVKVGIATIIGEVGSDIGYALFLEIGTSKMAARPFLRPAVKSNRRKINKIFAEANS